MTQVINIPLLPVLGQKKAQEQVCFFLQQMLNRKRGNHKGMVDLAMTRQNTSDHLDPNIETVSRGLNGISLTWPDQSANYP